LVAQESVAAETEAELLLVAVAVLLVAVAELLVAVAELLVAAAVLLVAVAVVASHVETVPVTAALVVAVTAKLLLSWWRQCPIKLRIMNKVFYYALRRFSIFLMIFEVL
jgi:hypothetical protein